MSPMNLQLQCYGTITLRVGAEPIELPTVKARLMLVYLLLGGQRSIARRTLADLFWPDMAEQRGLANLSTLLSLVRRALPAGLRGLLTADAQRVAIDDALVQCDVFAVDALLARVERHMHRSVVQCPLCIADLSAALELLREPFCNGIDLSDSEQLQYWLDTLREQTRRHTVQILEPLITHAALVGAWPTVISRAERLLQEDPWHEPALQQLMRAYAAVGQLAHALQRYELFRVELARELHCEPLAETQQFAAELRRTGWTPPETLTLREGERCFGRRAELNRLFELIGHPERRLVTICGLGGVGKTLLAQTAVRRLAPLYRDGAVLAALDGVDDVRRVVPLIAQRCGVALSGSSPPAEQLASALAERELLLVLDNAEHITGIAELINRLVQQTRQPIVIVTSRRPLQLWQEAVLDLHGFAVEEEGGNDEDRNAVLELLADRLQRIGAGGRAIEAEQLLQISRAVGGLPLALELAARRLAEHSVEEVLQQLQHDSDQLFSSAPDLPQRQRRVQLIFRQAWQELSAVQQQALADLTVISGVLQPEAVGAVLGEGAADLLRGLNWRGLVLRRGERDSLHPLVRRLVQRIGLDIAGAQARHAAYYLGLLDGAGLRVIDGPTRRRAAALAEHYDNLQRAWRWTAHAGDRQRLQELTESLVVLVTCLGWYGLGADLLTDSAEPADDAYGGTALSAAGRLRLLAGEFAAVRRLARRAQRLRCDDANLADLIYLRAQVLHEEGQYRAAARLAQFGLAWAGDEAARSARLLHTVGRALMWDGDLTAADLVFVAALQDAERSGNRGLLIECLNDRAQIPARRNDLAGCLPLLEAAAAETMLHGEVQSQIASLINIGSVRAVLRLEPDGAVALMEQALQLARWNRNQRELVAVLHSYAYGLIHLQRLERPAALLTEALTLALQIGHEPFTLEMIEGLGLLAAHQGQAEQAQRLLATAAAHKRTPAYVRQRAAQALQQFGLSAELPAGLPESGLDLGRQVLTELQPSMVLQP